MVLAVALGCGAPLIRLRRPSELPDAEEFVDVRRAWSREATVIPLQGFENILTISATYHSLEFRSAFMARYARDFAAAAAELARLRAEQLALHEHENTFFVTAYAGTEFRDANLADPDRGWRLLLVTARGRHRPTRIERVGRPNALQRAYYPRVNPQRQAFLVHFAVRDAAGAPVLPPELSWFDLLITGPRGRARLRWDLGR